MTDPLIEEASKKAAIAWISVDGGHSYAVWCLTVDSDICLVTGPGEQDLPGLETATAVNVTLRGDHGGGIVTYPVTVTRIRPESERWESVAPQLAAKRLNVSGTAEDLMARWAKECGLWALSAAGEPTERDDRSGSAEPRPTPAANATRKPFKLHRVRTKRT
ncbi:MAG TPA: hypothetical protein DGT23_32910 [Micromonosporaceae bacterium]|nr:hypothetical protein [Micromonosporaceae bacterium]